MQIVNPLRAALPYITLQTAKVQHCWADYFIFSRVCGGRRPFRLRRNTRAPLVSAAPPPGLRPALSARPAPHSHRSSAPFAQNEKPGRAAAFLAALSACFPSAVWSLGIT